MKEADLLGTAEVSVSEVMGARSWTVTKKLSAQKLNKNYGSITIKGHRVAVMAQSQFIILPLDLLWMYTNGKLFYSAKLALLPQRFDCGNLLG